MAKCRSCGASIMWALTAHGKRMPVDAEESPDGNVWVGEDDGGVLRLYAPAEGVDLTAEGCTRHKSHFATCAFAAQHRRR